MRRPLAGEMRATQWYCPAALGYILAISANEVTMARDPKKEIRLEHQHLSGAAQLGYSLIVEEAGGTTCSGSDLGSCSLGDLEPSYRTLELVLRQ